ncbi:hypothetical protein GCM10011414_28640 [Croceivirga lutea]|uniref:PQQ-dependent sugar dehydrogenase n=1 Tax=Croceivirga lutea TaxID=1775167 RepID=UPI00163A1276|nr:PQQ-dependent sugar dehydrogenase [Croceivirga lutea]GGG57065.1 hypothetical protein GCM10011414_28640 [Croceivirga lutea]
MLFTNKAPRIVFSSLLFFNFLFFSFSALGQISYEQAYENLAFRFPVEIQFPDDDLNNVYVVEQGGIIKSFSNTEDLTSNSVTNFLDISNKVSFSVGQEIGLLGLAFHPDFKNNQLFYVYYTVYGSNGRINMVLERYTKQSGSNIADSNSATEIFRFEKNQNNSNHNGGKIAFGPDGYLYISIGDGGGGGDPNKNAQNLNNVFGSILRIDVDLDGNNPIESNPASPNGRYEIPNDNPLLNKDGLDEIYAWGIRNTWKFSFDNQNRLWGADVGQNNFEEINLISRGQNYGWNKFEAESQPSYGTATTLASPTDVKPIYYYDHANGDVSITGGYFYDSSGAIQNSKMLNKYIYGDYVSGRVWALEYDFTNNVVESELLFRTNGQFISSFGLDTNGDMYFSDYGESVKIYKIVDTETPTDTGKTAQVLDGAWNQISSSVNGVVEAIAIDNEGNYYIGGNFSNAGSITANNIAKYNAVTGWEALGQGVNGQVNTITLLEDEVIVGGEFSTAGGTTANSIAKWSGNAWQNYGEGTNGAVLTTVVGDDKTIYVGGTFSSVGNINANNIALIQDNNWKALIDAQTAGNGTNNEVRSIALDKNSNVYLGGNFDSAGNKNTSRIAMWNGSSFSALGDGTSGFVQAIEVTEAYIYAGGNFSLAGNKTVNRLARWNRSSSSWESVDEGLNGNVNSITTYKNGLLIGGNFTNASGFLVDNIAYYDFNNWYSLGNATLKGVDAPVRKLVYNALNDEILVGGTFKNAGSISSNGISVFKQPKDLEITCPSTISLAVENDSCEQLIKIVEPEVTGDLTENIKISGTRSDGLDLTEAFKVGETTIEWVITRDDAIIKECIQLIELIDETLPTAVCKDITFLLANENEVIQVSPLDLDNGSTDNCGVASIEINPSSFSFKDLGQNEVEFIVTDVNGNKNNCLATVTIDFESDDLPTECGALPTGWNNEDIGDVAAVGSACYVPATGSYQIEASGYDIWETNDEFHFVYQTLSGNGEIVARVTNLENTNAWAKAGVMMRNSNASGSEFILMSLSPNPRNSGISYTLQDRPEFESNLTPGANNIGPVPVENYPHFLRLVREGNQFSGYASTTNGDWVLVGSKEIGMNEEILIGLAVTSHNDGVLTSATFDNVFVSTPTVENSLPFAIANEDILLIDEDNSEAEEVTLDASNSYDLDGEIVSYQWLINDTIVANGINPTIELEVGEYLINLLITDNDGGTASDEVLVTIEEGPQNLVPIANAGENQILIDFDENGLETVTLDGSGSFDPDGEIVNYEWSLNENVLAENISPTIELEVGVYVISLTVTDEFGDQDSAQVNIEVQAPIIVEDCTNYLQNENPAFVLPEGILNAGADIVEGTNEITNNSPCALVVSNFDEGQRWSKYHIAIRLADYNLSAGDRLFIGIDGNDGTGNARFEINIDNRPNTSLGAANFNATWSRYETEIIIPEGIASIDLWLHSNYTFTTPGSAYYDNLEVYKIEENLVPLQANVNKMLVSPNPAQVTSNVSFEKPEEVSEILIFDMSGRMIKKYNAANIKQGEEFKMEVNEIPAGTYIIRSKTIDGARFSSQMVIER